MLRQRADRLAFVFCLLFVAIASLWISEIGIQNDEALFAAGMYPPFTDSPHVFGKPFPTMVMTYVGTLKSHIYKPILRHWRPSAASIRFPGIVLGAFTIWFFYVLLKRTTDTRTALVGTALLATDTSFTLTTRWDWGPVVFQHLCLVGGVLAIARFGQTARTGWLAAGFFVFGLGVWDKAIFLWSLAGLGCAVLAVFPRRFLELLRFKTAAIACLAFLAGALPFITYNLRNDFATFRQKNTVAADMVAYKAALLRSVLDGSSLFGSIPRDNWEEPFREPDDTAKRVWTSLTEFFGAPRKNLQFYLFLTVLALFPLVWKTPARTPFLFAMVYLAVTWAQMVFIKEAGTGAHHPVLMWPMPHLAMAAVLAEASRRAGGMGAWFLAGVVGLVCCTNLLVTGSYYINMLRNGGNVAWSDAIYPTSEALPGMQPAYVCVLDWGFFEPVRLLHRGRIPLCNAADPDHDLPFFRTQVANPGIVYIAHTRENEFNKGFTERFLARAREEGYQPSSKRVFYDYNGRPIIEAFKLSASKAP